MRYPEKLAEEQWEKSYRRAKTVSLCTYWAFVVLILYGFVLFAQKQGNTIEEMVPMSFFLLVASLLLARILNYPFSRVKNKLSFSYADYLQEHKERVEDLERERRKIAKIEAETEAIKAGGELSEPRDFGTVLASTMFGVLEAKLEEEWEGSPEALKEEITRLEELRRSDPVAWRREVARDPKLAEYAKAALERERELLDAELKANPPKPPEPPKRRSEKEEQADLEAEARRHEEEADEWRADMKKRNLSEDDINAEIERRKRARGWLR